MHIIGDRFVLMDNGGAIDLATGFPALVFTRRAGDRAADVRWAMRCDRLLSVRHPHTAAMLDYGEYGAHEGFEAWECAGEWHGPGAAHARALQAGTRFLQGLGLTADASAASVAVHGHPPRPVYVPGAVCGYEVGANMRERAILTPALDLDDCGMRVVHRPSVTALAELFRCLVSHPRAVAVWGAPGSGVTLATLLLARAARLQGYVPLAAHLVGPALLAAVRGRSLMIIERREPKLGWAALAAAAVESPRAHVLLFAGRREVTRVPGVALTRVAADLLSEAVLPRARSDALSQRVERCARHARGMPGRFAALLWRDCGRSSGGAASRRWMSVAAERPLPYGDADSRTPPDAVSREPREWPAPAEIVTLRRRLASAIDALRRGRHAGGERALRAAIGGLARRGQWLAAARGALALAQSLLSRGRPRDAQAVLADAKAYAEQAGDDTLPREMAVLLGTTWIDLARLQEAEHVLHALVLPMDAREDPAAAEARLALARCLFWRGRYSEAERLLPQSATADSTGIRTAISAARLAVARGDLAGGITAAGQALAAAEALADPALIAAASCAAALAHLATGDHAAVAGSVARAVGAARTAHAPLVAIRARLLAAESERRSGHERAARTLVERVQRLGGGSLPPIVRARCALLLDLLASERAHDIVRRHVASSGLEGLAAYAPAEPAVDRARVRAALDHAQAILQCCHSPDDDTTVLPRIAALVRGAVGAAGAAFFSSAGTACVPTASDGSRIDPIIAERALSVRHPIAPHLRDGVIEAAAAIVFGGQTLGALAARWTLGSRVDAGHVMSLLTMAAAAAAPVVAAVHARRQAPRPGPAGELLGVSAAMGEVRRAVERAALAPFAVLIEGESGCGKELVARALHRSSPRRDRPFCPVNCAALPDDLVEAELFGHAKGAFTGAIGDRPGVFEEAHTGTLFLDEIGELSPRAQAKVLRAIQESEVRRVGENASRRVDVRIVVATNRNLRDEAREGRFRVDLLYRLDVLRIPIPPLRDRPEDIPLLAERFWQEATARVESRAVLSAATLSALSRYDWPGNVRELQNVLAALAVRSSRRGVVPPTALPFTLGASAPPVALNLETARRSFEERFVRAALVRTGGHRTRTAEELGVTRQGLAKLMARLGITDQPSAPP